MTRQQQEQQLYIVHDDDNDVVVDVDGDGDGDALKLPHNNSRKFSLVLPPLWMDFVVPHVAFTGFIFLLFTGIYLCFTTFAKAIRFIFLLL